MLKLRRLPLIAVAVYVSALASNSPQPGPYKNCGEDGTGGDVALNLLKNRAAQVTNPRPIQAADIKALPVPPSPDGRNYPSRSAWSASALKVIAGPEATGVSFEGVLLAVKQQSTEACNCWRTDLNDYHIWVVPAGAQPIKGNGMVVEATPRCIGANPAWSLSAFQKLAFQHAKVRITGWLLFDQVHPYDVGKTRATLWEIHPITRIEVFTSGHYRELQ